MKRQTYKNIENYMLSRMKDSAHDKEHIYRVLYVALDIAGDEENVDLDVLIAACLLHDIGREEQYHNPQVCHAQAGSKTAYEFLLASGWPQEKAWHVRECILTHRYRYDTPPDSMEAKILFDSDKIDATGTLGIARTLIYKGQVSDPLYSLDEEGNVLDGASGEPSSFFQEYRFKLEKLYDRFYTRRGRQIAQERQGSAVAFYKCMLEEVKACYAVGKHGLNDIVNE